MWQATVRFPCSRSQIDIIQGEDIHAALPALKSIKKGWLNLFVRGSGIALSVNENCDPTVRSDLTQALERILPTPLRTAGSLAADARALLMSTSLTLPITSGKIAFGTWQGVYFARLRPDASGDLILTLAEGDGAAQSDFTFDANKRSSHAIGAEVERALNKDILPEVSTPTPSLSTLLVHEKHTSASMSLVGTDVEPTMRVVVPEKWNEEFFEHTYEGPDDMPGHVKCTLLGCGVVVPLVEGRALLGSGQNLLLNEHRDVGGFGVGHSRRIQVTELPSGYRRLVAIPRDERHPSVNASASGRPSRGVRERSVGRRRNASPSSKRSSSPSASASGALVDITGELRTVVAEASIPDTSSPGLVHIFAASPQHGVIVAGARAAKVLAGRLQELTPDAAARAAIAKNGPVLPLDEQGQLMLGDGQQVWLYDAADGGTAPLEGNHIVITVHRFSFPFV